MIDIEIDHIHMTVDIRKVKEIDLILETIVENIKIENPAIEVDLAIKKNIKIEVDLEITKDMIVIKITKEVNLVIIKDKLIIKKDLKIDKEENQALMILLNKTTLKKLNN